MANQVLVVEDDSDQLENYRSALAKRGFDVLTASNEIEAKQTLTYKPDLALLDIDLNGNPDGGFDLCRWLLDRYPDLPIIFLSSRIDEIDQIFGLRLGAWDYLTKPISLVLLAEKVSAVLKRGQAPDKAPTTEVDNLKLDINSARASWKNQPLRLTVTELCILEALVAQPGHVIGFDALAEKTRQTVVTNNTLSTHIKHLRAKFRRTDPHFDRLTSVYGLGYRWSPDNECT